MIHVARAVLALSAAIFLTTSFPLMAADKGVPKLNIEKRCRNAQHTTQQMLGDVPLSDAVDSCIRDEQAARESLVRTWATMSASAKARCVQPAAFSASYLEWRECVEMAKEVRMTKIKRGVSPKPSLVTSPIGVPTEDTVPTAGR